MTLKDRIQAGEDVIAVALCTIPSAAVTQALAAAGLDAVIVDLEHGAIDYASAHAMMAACAGTGCAPWVRVTEIDAAQVKRVLDLGAEGVVFPMVRTPEDARAAVAAMHYPPKGVRGFGPFLAHAHHGTSLMDYRAAVEPKLVTTLLVETKDAVDNIEEICAVEGIDLLIPAQFDLSTDLGIPGQFDHPDFVAAVGRIEAAARATGLPLGNVALSEAQAADLCGRGYRCLCGFDVLWLGAAARSLKGWAVA